MRAARRRRVSSGWRDEPTFVDRLIMRSVKGLLALALFVWVVFLSVVVADLRKPDPASPPTARELPADLIDAFPPGPPPPWVMPDDWRPIPQP